jgi:hypothetical protein
MERGNAMTVESATIPSGGRLAGALNIRRWTFGYDESHKYEQALPPRHFRYGQWTTHKREKKGGRRLVPSALVDRSGDLVGGVLRGPADQARFVFVERIRSIRRAEQKLKSGRETQLLSGHAYRRQGR